MVEFIVEFWKKIIYFELYHFDRGNDIFWFDDIYVVRVLRRRKLLI